MMSSYPSIQSFYKREVQKPAVEAQGAESGATGATKDISDGFTEEELTEALDPLTRKWNPEREYEELTIEQLSSGPGAVNFVGRVVNFSTIYGRSPKQPKATGWHYLIVKDDTSCISVKLYFANKPYPLKFGQLLSIWTAFIADATKAEYSITSLTANMFPGRCTSDHIMLHTVTATFDTSSAHRCPLSYTHGAPLPDLMTLKTYLTSGHDGISSVKILVCVKSIGARKKFNKKNGGECEMIEVMLFDHTGDIKLKVWQEGIDSVRNWVPGETILLISNPGFKVEFSGRGSIGIQPRTMLEVDPEFPDAEWLRKYAVGLKKQESLGKVFPEGVWDVEACEKGVNRILFTLADVDEWVRSSPHHLLTGYLSLILTDLSLVLLRTRNMLHCTTCCGIPIYSNKSQIPCPHCSKSLNLVLNPKIVGKCIDETGCITAGKLLWSDTAWKDLFGRSVNEIPEMTAEEARLWEQRCRWLRVHVVFGWSEDVGRLAILRIKM